MTLLSQCVANYTALTAQNHQIAVAAVNTIVFLAGFVGFGLLIRLVADGLTALLGLAIGRAPAFTVRNYLTYPGVVHHELAHALFAWIAGARVERAFEILGDDVPAHLLEAGTLRLKYKQASLEELGKHTNPPLTKDAVAGRIRRLLALADKVAHERGIPDTESALTLDMLEED